MSRKARCKTCLVVLCRNSLHDPSHRVVSNLFGTGEPAGILLFEESTTETDFTVGWLVDSSETVNSWTLKYATHGSGNWKSEEISDPATRSYTVAPSGVGSGVEVDVELEGLTDADPIHSLAIELFLCECCSCAWFLCASMSSVLLAFFMPHSAETKLCLHTGTSISQYCASTANIHFALRNVQLREATPLPRGRDQLVCLTDCCAGARRLKRLLTSVLRVLQRRPRRPSSTRRARSSTSWLWT